MRLSDRQIQKWAVDRLLPYARNARTHSDEQVAQIAASIAEFGWTNPVLVGADGLIHGLIGGGIPAASTQQLEQRLTELRAVLPLVQAEVSDLERHAVAQFTASAEPR